MSDVIIELTERVRQDYKDLPKSIQAKFNKQLRFLFSVPSVPPWCKNSITRYSTVTLLARFLG